MSVVGLVRCTIAPFVGLLVFILAVMALEAIGHAVYPPPADIVALSKAHGEAMVSGDPERYEQASLELAPAVEAWLATAPIGPLLAVVIAWVGGGLLGSLAAAAVATAGRMWFSLLIGAVDVIGILMATDQFSHPTWMPVLGILGVILASLLAGRLMTRGRSAPALAPAIEKALD
ncbi:MAG: hypothetical protein CBB69_013045 [Phycisphaera sp. TMED9]|nr:MAG: hypothetical protein CBB69_013045 [Phycisphaera sp. TMED9]